MVDLIRNRHAFGSLKIYPRVYNFHNRLRDVLARFHKVEGSLPECFRNKALINELGDITRRFENGVEIEIFGDEDLQTHQFLKEKEFITIPQEEKPPGLHVRIYCKLMHIENAKELQEAIDQVLQETADEQDVEQFILIKSNTEHKVIENERATCEDRAKPRFQLGCIAMSCEELKENISYRLENIIVQGLHKMYVFLQQFEPISNQFYLEPEDDVLKSETLKTAVLQFLRSDYIYQDIYGNIRPESQRQIVPIVEQNRAEKQYTAKTNKGATHAASKEAYKPADHDVQTDTGKVDPAVALGALARVMRCSSIDALSKKYCLPAWMCNSLLCQVDFEEAFVKHISKNTRYHFRKRCEKEMSDLFKRNKSFDFVLYHLQSDLETFFKKVEETFEIFKKLAMVMKRMNFELCGYLKQTVVTDVKAKVTEHNHATNVETCLRKDLLKIEGIYGLGTIFGKLEIHVDRQKFEEAKTRDVLKKITAQNTEKQTNNTEPQSTENTISEVAIVASPEITDNLTRTSAKENMSQQQIKDENFANKDKHGKPLEGAVSQRSIAFEADRVDTFKQNENVSSDDQRENQNLKIPDRHLEKSLTMKQEGNMSSDNIIESENEGTASYSQTKLPSKQDDGKKSLSMKGKVKKGHKTEKELTEEFYRSFKHTIHSYLMQHKYVYPYSVRYVDCKPSKCLNAEPGVTLKSPGVNLKSQNKGKGYTSGTLGGYFVFQNKIFALTCGHVIGPYGVVYLDGSDITFSNTFKKCTTGGCALPLVDIAALHVHSSYVELCKKIIESDQKHIRVSEVTVSADMPSELIGRMVHKFGAATGYTEGMILSVDYSCNENVLGKNGDKYLILIDHKANLSDSVTVAFDSMVLMPTETNGAKGNEDDLHMFLDVTGDSSEPAKVENKEHTLNNSKPSDNETGANSGAEGKDNLKEQMNLEVSGTGDDHVVISIYENEKDNPFTQPENHHNTSCDIPRLYVRDKYSVSENEISTEDVFGKPGDSGSIICIDNIPEKFTFSGLSMFSAGNFKVNGYDGKMCLSFLLPAGLDALNMRVQSDFKPKEE